MTNESTEEIPHFHFAVTDDLVKRCQGTEFQPKDFLPTLMNDGDTGYDVRAAESIEVSPGEYFKVSLGLKMLAPPGWWIDSRPRSSTFVKKCTIGHTGTIDNQFPLTIIATGLYLPNGKHLRPEPLKIEFGDRIFQFLPKKVIHMKITSLSEEEIEAMRPKSTRTGGTGSTGDK